jgi:hypothetical protein
MPSPGAEFRIAAGGPLCRSIPALSLDGGRILRAGLSARLTSPGLRRLLVVHDFEFVALLSETDVMRVLEVRTRAASTATERRRPQRTAARPLSSSRWAR